MDKKPLSQKKIDIPKTLLRPDEAAKILNVSKYTIYRLINEGQLKGTKIRRSVRIFGSSLEEYIEKNIIQGI